MDWGLDNQDDRHLLHEHACLRLQAALLIPRGLRGVFAPTTDHRAFYDALPEQPLGPGREPASVLARMGLRRANKPPWGPHLACALDATATVVRIVAPLAQTGAEAALFHRYADPAPVHPLGSPACPEPGRTCQHTRN